MTPGETEEEVIKHSHSIPNQHLSNKPKLFI
jgi:hypothetical protein